MGRKRDKQLQVQKRRKQRQKQKQLRKKYSKKMRKSDMFKLGKEYVQYSHAFDAEMVVLDMKIKDVVGDGNCLFRAFADQIDGDQTAHEFMRAESCNYMAKNPDFFIPFLDEDDDGTLQQYLQLMRKDGEWGGHLELQALCECFRCIAVIHKRDLQQLFIMPMTQKPQTGIIHLGYFQHEDFEHYVSIRQQGDMSNNPGREGLQNINKANYNHLKLEYNFGEQQEELKLELAALGLDEKEHQQKEDEEPYPNYPRNKKCKCGSKVAYKNCCYKEYMKKIYG